MQSSLGRSLCRPAKISSEALLQLFSGRAPPRFLTSCLEGSRHVRIADRLVVRGPGRLVRSEGSDEGVAATSSVYNLLSKLGEVNLACLLNPPAITVRYTPAAQGHDYSCLRRILVQG